MKYIMLFYANFDHPPLLSHFVIHLGTLPKVRHTSRTPPQILVVRVMHT